MTDITDVAVAIETDTTPQVVTPAPEPDAAPVEEKQVEPTFTKAQVEQRIQERLAKEQRRYERRLESEIESLRQAAQPKAPIVEQPGRPDRAQYANDEQFIEDLAGWKADQKISEKLTVREQQASQEAQRRETTQALQTHGQREDALRKTNPEYDALVRNNDDLPISRAMAETIVLSDKGPEVALYLGNHPEESARIASMSYALAAKEIGKIEAKLEASAPKISTAPAPMKPVGSAKAIATDLANASMEEYRKLRKAQGARWAR